MNELNRPHFMFYIVNVLKGLYPYPEQDSTWDKVRECKRMADLYGSGQIHDRGAKDLPSDDELFRRFWYSQLSEYNGGLRIEQIEVRNIDDAREKMVDVRMKEGFVKFLHPDKYERKTV